MVDYNVYNAGKNRAESLLYGKNYEYFIDIYYHQLVISEHVFANLCFSHLIETRNGKSQLCAN